MDNYATKQAKELRGNNRTTQSSANGLDQSAPKVVQVSKQIHYFPMDVFPTVIQEVINEYRKASPMLSAEHFCSAILSVCSLAIGNTIKIKVKNRWTQPVSLYVAMVSGSGEGKTPIFNLSLSPIYKIKRQQMEEYIHNCVKYEELKSEAKENGGDPPQPPINFQLTASDTTQEGLADILMNNKRGLLLKRDELGGWLKDLDRYNKGGQEEFYNEIWNVKSIDINRKTDGYKSIEKPFVTIFGGIQPFILSELTNAQNVANGFIARFCFSMPSCTKFKPLTEYEANEANLVKYERFVQNLYSQTHTVSIEHINAANTPYPVGMRLVQGVLEMTNEAKAIYFEYHNSKTKQISQTSNQMEKNGISKLRDYCLRFALILQLVDAVANGREIKKVGSINDAQAINEEVTPETLKKAIKVCDYFESTLLSLVDSASQTREEKIIAELPEETRKFYEKLPVRFETKEGEELAHIYSISRAVYFRLLKRKELFKRRSRGNYTKCITVEG